MSCPKISALLSQHWRHSAHCDCLGSCWRAISLNEDCKHAGKKVLTWPCALEGQVYASTSTDSWFQPQWEESWQVLWLWCCVMLHIMASCGNLLKNEAGDVVKVLDVLSEGDSTRPVGYCGHPWQELYRVLLNGVFQCHEAQKTHIHPGRSDLLSENVACQALDKMELSG